MSGQSEMFLNDEQVIKLTGCKTKKLQCENLKRQGIPFHTNAKGKPIVCRVHVEGMSPAANDPEPEPASRSRKGCCAAGLTGQGTRLPKRGPIWKTRSGHSSSAICGPRPALTRQRGMVSMQRSSSWRTHR